MGIVISTDPVGRKSPPDQISPRDQTPNTSCSIYKKVSITHFRYIDPETIDREFKEFMLIPKLFIGKSIINSVPSQQYFNSNILQTIEHNINKYFPKYSSIFASIPHATLHLGVSDCGQVIGVPYYGKLPYNALRKMMCNALDFIHVERYNKNKWFRDNIQLEIVEITGSDDEYAQCKAKVDLELHSFEERFRQIDKEVQHKRNLYQHFVEKHQRYFHGKLVEILKRTVEEFQEWVMNEIAPQTELSAVQSAIPRAISQSTLDIIIDTPRLIHLFEYEKLDITHPELLQTFIRFKASRQEKIKHEFCIRDLRVKHPPRIDYNHFYKSIYRLAPLLHENGANFYLINIHFNGNGRKIYYSASTANQWVSKKRILNHSGEPSCCFA